MGYKYIEYMLIHLKKMEKLNDGGKQLNIVLQVHLSNHI